MLEILIEDFHKMNGFSGLGPDEILNAVEQFGFETTGRILQLNSYENRVYMIDLENEDQPEAPKQIVAKFYRPGRWSDAAILEEHNFLRELESNEFPVITALMGNDNSSIQPYKGFSYSLFPKAKGRLPEEFSESDLKHLGRMLARLHNVGSEKVCKNRPVYSVENLGWPILKLLENWVAGEVYDRYMTAAEVILENVERNLKPQTFIRIHGDFHRGNLLFDERIHDHRRYLIMDFDDFGMGPPAQDFWMIAPTEEDREVLLDGYSELRDYDEAQLKSIPLLRGFRIIRYAGWIAQRWEDPSFPQLFPQFRDYNYWAEEVEQLEKISWDLS